jgi:REP element-mobilizing transposase RayT
MIVADDEDRAAFVARFGAVATATGTRVYAWALLPNHAHVLLRSGPAGLPRFMRRFLTGYALAYNRRHHRVGHVFQNRYKSIVVEAEPYLLELVRYIHLNPLRARLVPDLRGLARYPGVAMPASWATGRPPGWIARLSWARSAAPPAPPTVPTAPSSPTASPRGTAPTSWGVDSSALCRPRGPSAGCPVLADERILGTDTFVARMLAAGDPRQRAQRTQGRRLREAQGLLRRRCRQARISLVELQAGSRRRIATLRADLAVYLVTQLGLSLAETARQLGVSTSG